ncbi:MAG: metallophosphoesterase [Chloroflexota bacterium]
MSIWAIADIHASQTNPLTGHPSKPMDVFGDRWLDHLARLEANWIAAVQQEDTVIIAGDIDWALHPPEALETLERLASWPGRKILLRGNHDYWWSSKTTTKVRRLLPDTVELLHNNAIQAEGFNICGTKGSAVPGGADWSDEQAKLLNRETQRLVLSLNSRRDDLPTIVALHFPPFYPPRDQTPYKSLIDEAGSLACAYGHLHGAGPRTGGPVGRFGRTEYFLVAGDYVDFRPVLIASGGEIVRPHRVEYNSARAVDE